ncbi:MAG: hypothetical protein Q8R28_08325 [Dehalococcoidia bacterium]|nr:hypothetical protein [Dehalococcoidia bacterium]
MGQAAITESSAESLLPPVGMPIGIITAYPLVRLLAPGGQRADFKAS